MQKKKRGKSLPKSPRPIDGVVVSNRSKYLSTPKGVYSLLENRFLKGCKGAKGYMQVWLLCDDGVRRWFQVHRMIAEGHVPNPNNLPVCHHKNHNKLSNHPSNLSWVSQRTNVRLAMEAGRWKNRNVPKGPEHANYGKKFSTETRQRMSETKSGLNNPRCKGPYVLNGFEAATLKQLSKLTGVALSEINRLNKTGALKAPGKKVLSSKKLSEIFEREQRPGLRI